MFEKLIYLTWETPVFTIINFFIMFFILKHFLYKPVKKMLDARRTEVEETYKNADTANATATALKAEYEARLSVAKSEASELIKQATVKAQVRSDEITTDAQHKATMIIKKAETQLELDKKKVMNELKTEVAGMAIMAASKVCEKSIDEQEHRTLIENFIENVGDTQWQN